MGFEMSQNPLSGYFRQPAIHMKLPSQGKFWPEDALDLPVTGEIPILPMTSRDEITLRTPDALLNGSAIVDLIHSCCPNIKDAWVMPAMDIDPLLIGIRIASYGNEIDFDNRCPHCGHDNTHSLDLSTMLGNTRVPNYNEPIEYNQLLIKLRPQNYRSISETSRINFEEQQLLRSLKEEDTEELKQQIKSQLELLISLSLKILVNSTEYIELSDRTRVDRVDYLEEFYNNAETKLIKTVKDRLAEIAKDSEIKPIAVLCQSCEKDYEVSYTFDYSSFFDLGF